MDEPWRLPAEVMCRVQHEKTWSSGQRGCILRPCQGQNGNPGLVCRSDYIGPLTELGLPRMEQARNWREVPPFTQAASREFLTGSGLKIGQGLLYEILHEASELEENKGLIRPITLNMFGIILGRYAGRLPKGLEPGTLIRDYLRETINQPHVRDLARRILREMITPAGTKQPRSQTELCEATGIEPGSVRGCLFSLGNDGIVRLIDRETETWEVSHDFIARLLDHILAKWRVSFFRKLRPWIGVSSLVLWATVVFAFLPSYQEDINFRKTQELGLMDATVRRTAEGRHTISFDQVSKEDLSSAMALLQGLTSLQSLSLGYRVKDLTPLKGLTSLETLDLARTQVTDLTPLEGLTNLETLDLSGTQVTDLTPLEGLTNLQKLDLSGTQVTDPTPIAGLTNLRSLVLYSAKVTDLTGLGGLPSLQSLDLRSTAVTDLTPLEGLPNLQSLDLRSTAVTDLTGLEGLTNLQSLDLARTKVTDLTPLEGLPNLQKLYLERTAVTDLTGLEGLPSLQTLDLRSTAVTDLTPLEGLTNLQTLDLRSTAVTDLTGLEGLPNLQKLYLERTAVTDLTGLEGLPNLQSLDLARTKVTDLTPLEGLSNLQKLDLYNAPVTEEQVVALLAALPNLRIDSR